MLTKKQAAKATATKATKNTKLTEKDFRDLLESLLKAETEAEVAAIIAANPAFSDPANWLPLDGRVTNWNVTTNQSASGPKAATELVTNGVDAILIRHCVAQGIDPRSPEAPRTSHEAIERFLGWKGGRMMEHMPKALDRTKWAEANFVVAFSGVNNDPGQPSLTFCDSGEGQHPHDFERTFLSLSAGNKAAIEFVQGKFNMGSSGVIGYCGTRKYKLIVSRKHTMDGKWGWTLCRQRPTGDLPVVEYFKAGGETGEIPSFEADSLCPLYTRAGKPYEAVTLEFGTAVKLYDFDLGQDTKDFNATRRVFIEHLADTLVPLRILDMRATPSKDKSKGQARALGVDGRTFLGLEHHISTGAAQEDAVADAEVKGARRIDIGTINDPELGLITVRGYYTETPVTSSRSTSGGIIRSNSRVFHTVNGQIQHRESRGVLTECGLPTLKDHLVIVADASALTRRASFEIWKADREMIRETPVSRRYLKEIKSLVKDNAELAQLEKETFARTVSKAAESTAKTVFEKLVSKDPTLANLLSGHLPSLAAPQGPRVEGSRAEKPAFVGKFSPSFLKVTAAKAGIELPQGGKAIVVARTNACDDYMVRDVHPGQLTVSDNLKDAGVTVKRTSLKSGRMMLTLTAPADAPLGEMTASIGLTDASMDGTVEAEFLVRIVEATEKPVPDKKEKKERKPREPKQNQLSMPRVLLMTRDGRDVNGGETEAWEEGWTEFDGGTTLQGNDEVVVKINYDNFYIQDYLHRAKESEREAIWTKFMLAMQVSALGLERRISQIKESGEKVSDDEFDRLRRSATAGFASVAPTIVDQMPRIMVDSLATANDD